ncbi:MAG: hypothetical protein HY816_13125, partial [Candidatus Wallbacteria bacterium]|nr:hypothetical protein [Candidatus Wallbacteria bacterium]
MSGSGAVWTFTKTLAAGNDGSFTVTLAGRDRGGNALTIQPTNRTFTVATPARITVVSLNVDRNVVSRGQKSIVVTMQLRNPGGASAQLTLGRLGLKFNGQNASQAGFKVTTPTSPAIITGNGTASYSFTLEAGASALTGALALEADVAGTDLLTSKPLVTQGLATPPVLTVQSAAALTVTEIRLARPTLNPGRTVQIEVAVSNSGAAGVGAGATGVQAALKFNGATTGFTISEAPDNVRTLAAAASTLLTFTVSVDFNPARLGVKTVTATLAGVDANSNAAAAIVNTATASLKVQNPVPPTLAQTGITVARSISSAAGQAATVFVDQKDFVVRLAVTNTSPTVGGVGLRGLTASLKFNPAN